ncbi:MAG: response regulator [Ardenticatenaceae bacterium]|nr:response regulator [Ardenticatenaceae bacterium]
MFDNESEVITRLRILVADDVRSTVQSIRLMLRLLPDVEIVATAQDGQQAIELAEKHEPDIALIDINMPRVDGLTAVKSMLKLHPQMVCIIMSVEGDDSARQEATASGALDYLVKPFTTEELVSTIERASQLIMSRQPEDRDTALLRRKLTTAPLRLGKTTELRQQREDELKQLATKLLKAKRTDDEVIKVLEELAASPYCELHWLKWLALIYVNRNKWEKLEILVGRLKEQTVQGKPTHL